MFDTTDSEPTVPFLATATEDGIFITLPHELLIQALVQVGKELGVFPECFNPDEELRVLGCGSDEPWFHFHIDRPAPCPECVAEWN